MGGGEQILHAHKGLARYIPEELSVGETQMLLTNFAFPHLLAPPRPSFLFQPTFYCGDYHSLTTTFTRSLPLGCLSHAGRLVKALPLAGKA